jgi:hypothetical protein
LIEKVDFGIGHSLHQRIPFERPRVSSYRLNAVIGLLPADQAVTIERLARFV